MRPPQRPIAICRPMRARLFPSDAIAYGLGFVRPPRTMVQLPRDECLLQTNRRGVVPAILAPAAAGLVVASSHDHGAKTKLKRDLG